MNSNIKENKMPIIYKVIIIFYLVILTGCSGLVVGNESPSPDMAYVYILKDTQYTSNTTLKNAAFSLQMKGVNHDNKYHLELNPIYVKTLIYKVVPGRYKFNGLKFRSRLGGWHDNYTGRYEYPKEEFRLAAGKLYFVGQFTGLITQTTDQSAIPTTPGSGTSGIKAVNVGVLQLMSISDFGHVDIQYASAKSEQSISIVKGEYKGFAHIPVSDIFTEGYTLEKVVK